MPKFRKIYARNGQKQYVPTCGSDNKDFVRIIQKFG